MSEDDKRPIIIRRVKKYKKGGHHGGAWKIAYADFVTAMMAFFLLMWVMGLLNKYQLEGVGAYFRKPLKEAFVDQNYQKNVGIDKDKDKAKEKPNKVDQKPDKDKMLSGVGEKKAMSADQMSKTLQANLNKDPEMQQFKNHLNFITTAEGLKIEIHDLDNKPMFSSGKSDFIDYAKKIMSWLSAQLQQYPNQIVIIGHTDTKQYDDEEYTNWELSSDRANATRRALIQNGMDKNKVIRVIGVGDTELLDKLHGEDPSNRRIEMIVLSDKGLKELSPK